MKSPVSMEVTERQSLLGGHLIVALVQLLVGLLAVRAELVDRPGGAGGWNQSGLHDRRDGWIDRVEGSQTLAWPWKSHQAVAFGRNGLQAQNCVEDCAAIVHFRLSGTCEAVAVGMFAVKSPPTIACAGNDRD